MNFQILRRSFVTLFAKTETDATLRSSLAGHSVDVGENEYRQPTLEELTEAMEKFDRYLQ